MTYNDRGGRPRQDSGSLRGPSRPHAQGGRPRVSPQGAYHGPRGISSRPQGPRRSSGPGYPLRTRNINFQSGRGRRLSPNRRLLVLAALALVLLVLLVVGISSCVSSCSSGQSGEANPVDARVASGVPEDLTRSFATELNQGEKLAAIAANASAYQNQGLLELALSEPSAIDFVAAYPEAEKTAQPYEDAVEKGTVPQLVCWDSRWGNVDYAGAPLALTGSGPVALSMAHMAITGTADQTPDKIAQAVTEAEMASGDSSMAGTFLTDSLGNLGLKCSTYTSNEDNLVQALKEEGTYVLLETTADALSADPHWVLVAGTNADGSLIVCDPTSPDVTAHPWDAATVATWGGTIYAVSAAPADAE